MNALTRILSNMLLVLTKMGLSRFLSIQLLSGGNRMSNLANRVGSSPHASRSQYLDNTMHTQSLISEILSMSFKFLASEINTKSENKISVQFCYRTTKSLYSPVSNRIISLRQASSVRSMPRPFIAEMMSFLRRCNENLNASSVHSSVSNKLPLLNTSESTLWIDRYAKQSTAISRQSSQIIKPQKCRLDIKGKSKCSHLLSADWPGRQHSSLWKA